MNRVIARIFGRVGAGRVRGATLISMERIRHSLHGALHDCTDLQAERVSYKIKIAQTPSDLWLLRTDLHQCIAQVHSQQVAAERINALIPVFEGLLPARQLSRI